MVYIETGEMAPQWNLAAEEYLFKTIGRERDCFMLWQNDRSVIVGKNQDTAMEVDRAFLERHNIPAVRRMSGGGAVYHDLGNLNFTFITGFKDQNCLQLKAFCQPVIDTLRRLGVEAEITGRNDMTISGKKFSGNSQYREGDRLLHHGTLLFSSDLSAAQEALRGPGGKARPAGIPSVQSRITNIRDHLRRELSLEEFKGMLLESLGQSLERYVWSSPARRKVGELARGKYSSPAWNYGETPEGAVRRKVFVEGCGTVEAAFSVSGGRIGSISFYGDFFSGRDVDELAERLEGARVEDCIEIAQQLRLDEYFFRMDTESFLRLLGVGGA